mgnify:CR=1 FL=1
MKRKMLIHLFGIMALLLMTSGHSFAQNLRVQGRVLDELGEGLIGAGVVIQGTATGTVTDLDGNYVLPSVPEGATLEFSCVGYVTQQVQVTGPRLDVTLSPDTKLIDESVVIAYGSQNKVTITGSVSAVGGETLLKSPVANVANSLQGNLPGVSAVQPSGMPGADEPVIRIRGVGSLNSAEPLVLVDGVERPFSQLDPNEIESISVLKDASATAVFGVRGANGVILVTTKRGEVGKASVTASVSAAMQSISKFIDFTDSYTYGQMWNYTAITDALPMSEWPGSVQIDDYTPYANNGIRFSQEVMEHFRLGDMPQTFPDMDWIKYIMNDVAWQEQANVNVSGGTDRVRYFVSAGFLNQNSLFKTFSDNKNETFDYQRLNYRANLDIDVSKRSQLSITLGGRMQGRNTMGGGEGNLFRYLQGATPYAGAGIDEEGRHIVSDPSIVGPFDRSALSNYYNLGYVNERTNVLNCDIHTRRRTKRLLLSAGAETVYGLDEIYSSPSVRAKQTAQPTCEVLKKEPIILDWCCESLAWAQMTVEYEPGKLTWGYNHAPTRELFVSKEIRALGNKWYTHPSFDGTKFAEGVARVESETDKLLLSLGYRNDRERSGYIAEAHNNKRVALFAHEGFGMSFMSALLDIPYNEYSTRFCFGFTGMTVIEFTPDANGFCIPRVLQHSNDSHLYREGLGIQYHNRLPI